MAVTKTLRGSNSTASAASLVISASGWGGGLGELDVLQLFNASPSSVSGGGVNWGTPVATAPSLEDQRMVERFVSDAAPSDGDITITFPASGAAIAEVSEIAGSDGTWQIPQTARGESTTPTCPDLGTIDTVAGDLASFAALEQSGGGHTPQTDCTLVFSSSSVSTLRTLASGFSATVETPGTTLGGATIWGILGMIWNAAGGAATVGQLAGGAGLAGGSGLAGGGGGLVGRAMTKLNDLWVPDRRLVVPVGIQLQGA